MEQDVLQCEGRKDGLYPRAHTAWALSPANTSWLNCVLCIFDYKTVKTESSWLGFQVNSEAILAIWAASILLCLIQVPTGSRQESTTRRGVHTKAGSWALWLHQEGQCVGTLFKTRSLQSLHHHRASHHLIYALRLCFAIDTVQAQHKRNAFFFFCILLRILCMQG